MLDQPSMIKWPVLDGAGSVGKIPAGAVHALEFTTAAAVLSSRYAAPECGSIPHQARISDGSLLSRLALSLSRQLTASFWKSGDRCR